MNRMLPRPRFWALTAAQYKPRFTMLGELLIMMLLYYLSALASSLLLSIPMSAWLLGTHSADLVETMTGEGSPQTALLALMEQMPDWMIPISLFTSFTMGVAAIVYSRAFQKRSLESMGLGKGGFGEYALGFLVGLVLIGGVVAVGVTAGGWHLASSGGPERSQVLLALAALGGCMVRGAALELLFRGCFAPALGVRYPVVFPLLLSSFASAMLQSGGSVLSMEGLNALLLALFLGIWVLKRGRIWSACAIQAAWSFGSTFLFDFAPAEEHAGIRLLDMDADPFRALLTGGSSGPQGSICAVIVLLAALALVLAMKPREDFPLQGSGGNEQAPNFL